MEKETLELLQNLNYRVDEIAMLACNTVPTSTIELLDSLMIVVQEYLDRVEYHPDMYGLRKVFQVSEYTNEPPYYDPVILAVRIVRDYINERTETLERKEFQMNELDVVKEDLRDRAFEEGRYQAVPETLELLDAVYDKYHILTAITLDEVNRPSATTLYAELRRLVRDYMMTVGMNFNSQYLKDIYNEPIINPHDYAGLERHFHKFNTYFNYRTTIIRSEELARIREEQGLALCTNCGEEFEKEDCEEIASGVYVCPDCFEHYKKCEECGEYVHEDDLIYIENERISVCEDCYDEHFITCCACNEIIRSDESYQSDAGDTYCQYCYDERFIICPDCNQEVDIEYASYCDEDGCYYCDDCYQENHVRKIIRPYHDDVHWSTNSFMDEPIGLDTLIIGIEHEVAGDEDYAEEFATIVNPEYEKNVVLMHDSSVSGFEIISHPMTMNYFRYQFLPRYKKGLEFLKEHSFDAEGEGGIHIHFNEIRDTHQRARMFNILYGTVEDVANWCAITGRSEYSMNRWCSMVRDVDTTYVLERDSYTCAHKRYTALNHDDDRTGTHELRIFDSTLDAKQFETCVDILISLLDYTKEDRGYGVYTTTRSWVEFIKDNKGIYPLVFDRLDDQDIFDRYDINIDEVALA